MVQLLDTTNPLSSRGICAGGLNRSHWVGKGYIDSRGPVERFEHIESNPVRHEMSAVHSCQDSTGMHPSCSRDAQG